MNYFFLFDSNQLNSKISVERPIIHDNMVDSHVDADNLFFLTACAKIKNELDKSYSDTCYFEGLRVKIRGQLVVFSLYQLRHFVKIELATISTNDKGEDVLCYQDENDIPIRYYQPKESTMAFIIFKSFKKGIKTVAISVENVDVTFYKYIIPEFENFTLLDEYVTSKTKSAIEDTFVYALFLEQTVNDSSEFVLVDIFTIEEEAIDFIKLLPENHSIKITKIPLSYLQSFTFPHS